MGVTMGQRPMPSFRRMMVFIDGENIVFIVKNETFMTN